MNLNSICRGMEATGYQRVGLTLTQGELIDLKRPDDKAATLLGCCTSSSHATEC